ncbi:MAG: homocysteine S-methyltransferase family protein [Nitrospinae bacterium]|nr:homocysteine S-methyltransferase family protein [Nitrospinota bacterium]
MQAGANIIETNTFGGTEVVLGEYNLQNQYDAINKSAVNVARNAIVKSGKQDVFIAGSVGPTTFSLSLTGGVTFDVLQDNFRRQIISLIEGGSDLILIETSQDSLNLKAATSAYIDAVNVTGIKLPLMISGTIEASGKMLGGQNVEAFYASVMHLPFLTIGLNCATGPDLMATHIRVLSGLSKNGVHVSPNAGMPDENGDYPETPDVYSEKIKRFIDNGWVNVLGGCCGTTPGHIKKLAEVATGRKPRQPIINNVSIYSGIDFQVSDEENRPLMIGERTNVIGSRLFKELIVDKKFVEAVEVGRKQVRTGAHIIDVCLANPDSDELEDMKTFLTQLAKVIKVPVMIDSTDTKVVEEALKLIQGKALINSINLEDGEKKFEEITSLMKRYGAAVVVGTIDEDPEQGMAVTKERKLKIAERSYKLLTEKYGVAGEDIIFDPLVFPVGTGDKAYMDSAKETIEGIKAIKKAFPLAKTILGLSNVSFGLPPVGRKILNSVMLYHSIQDGLDMAIANPAGIVRYATIPENERKLAEKLIYENSDEAIEQFAAYFREAKVEKVALTDKKLSVEERIAEHLIEGIRENLLENLDEALQKYKPLELINGPLMEGMARVGKLFNNNELIVAEVLQSAEVMKVAVDYLEPKMFGDEKEAQAKSKKKFLLATVKGDVHDIGKDLVDIILSNNGYEVINLGIKIPPEKIIEAVEEHKPDAIGLSGLLVKSALQMVTTAEELRAKGISIPLLVGGAALTQKFTESKIEPAYGANVYYAKDAMNAIPILQKTLG